jgi:hypothetical protein
MPKDWKEVFQEELCKHGIELNLDEKKVKGLIPTCWQPKCSEGESVCDFVAYIDADAEVPVRSTLTHPDHGKLTVVSNNLQPSQNLPIYRILTLEKSPNPKQGSSEVSEPNPS